MGCTAEIGPRSFSQPTMPMSVPRRRMPCRTRGVSRRAVNSVTLRLDGDGGGGGSGVPPSPDWPADGPAEGGSSISHAGSAGSDGRGRMWRGSTVLRDRPARRRTRRFLTRGDSGEHGATTTSPVVTAASARVVGMPSAAMASLTKCSRRTGPSAALPSPRVRRASRGCLARPSSVNSSGRRRSVRASGRTRSAALVCRTCS